MRKQRKNKKRNVKTKGTCGALDLTVVPDGAHQHNKLPISVRNSRNQNVSHKEVNGAKIKTALRDGAASFQIISVLRGHKATVKRKVNHGAKTEMVLVGVRTPRKANIPVRPTPRQIVLHSRAAYGARITHRERQALHRATVCKDQMQHVPHIVNPHARLPITFGVIIRTERAGVRMNINPKTNAPCTTPRTAARPEKFGAPCRLICLADGALIPVCRRHFLATNRRKLQFLRQQ